MNIELLQALKDIRDALDVEDPDSWRCDDSEGAMDCSYEKARRAIVNAERDAGNGGTK